MPRSFSIYPNDVDRWMISEDGDGKAYRMDFRSYAEAYDALRSELRGEGLVAGRLQWTDRGFRVESFDQPIMYSGSASQLIEAIKYRFGRKLRRLAVEEAKSEGRSLISDDDIWEAAEKLVGPGLAEEPEDG